MSLAATSIKRPIFISCLIILMLAVGWFSFKKLGIDLFPNVTFPVVTVTTVYRGAGPEEIETLVSKPLEDEMSTISGIKKLSSINDEGFSTVIAEFNLETDVKFAEQQIRDRTSAAKKKLPKEIEEPIIRRIDPADQPVITLSVDADVGAAQLFDIANEVIRPKLEQVNQVGLVDVLGGRKREVRVYLDREKMKSHEISASTVAARISAAGENVPAGKVDIGTKELIFRSLGKFNSLNDIKKVVINFFGSDVAVSVDEIGRVVDGLTDEKSRVYVNGKKSLFINVYRQSGSNTLQVVDALKARVAKLNETLALQPGKPKIKVVRDGAVWIRANVDDVKESIMIGIVLAIVVVYFFLANGRSTIITGLALPNSLLGAFILMALAGFTINIMTLLALSLAVGLLVDDAIVVRENIFRHLEMGKSPIKAAIEGTKEVTLAVIATTFAVLAVFGPVGFLKGVTGQFFKEFGLTICFAMLISLFDALTIAPMLSAYFAGASHKVKTGIWYNTVGRLVEGFNVLQDKLEILYENLIKKVVIRPILSLVISVAVALASCSVVTLVPKTFLPPQDAGEFSVSMDLPPGTNLDETSKLAEKMDAVLRSNKEVALSALTIGSKEGAANEASFYVSLIPRKQRSLNTSQFKDKLREQFKEFAFANPKVKDYDAIGGGQRPFLLNILGADQKVLEKIGLDLLETLKKNPALKDVDINFRTGKPEFQVQTDNQRLDRMGVSTIAVGQELRAQIEGAVAAKYRENGREYDIRVRLEENQRNLKDNFYKTYVPNLNFNLVKLSDFAKPVETTGPSKITRQDRGRYVQIGADIAPGKGMGDAISDVNEYFKVNKLPEGMRYDFTGQAENFKELGESMATAMGFGILFLYLVLASLYESFVIPLTILLALPFAFSGAFVALAITGESLNLFSMIGMIMLLGVSAKNSILLVDFTHQLVSGGMERNEALIKAGRSRLRPILMTTFALIAGTLPIAMGLNEASKQRTSMGIAIIGGLISSTLLTLIVVPAAYSFIDRFRLWSQGVLAKIFMSKESLESKRD